MSFVVKMAWREVRTSWARLTFFFLCVGIGVAAIVALRSVIQHVRVTLTGEARVLVGADVDVQTPRPLEGALQRQVDALVSAAGPHRTAQFIDTQTMAAPREGTGNGNVKLVELRGVGEGYPLYGSVELASGAPYRHELVAGHGVLVQPELLVALDLEVGDTLVIAGQPFTIRGVVSRDRAARGGGIAFGPRVYMDLSDLNATSLLGFGSRSSHHFLIRLDAADPRSTSALTGQLEQALSREIGTVRSWQTLEERVGRNLTTAENYLSLVGLAIVVLGGIGVWSVTRVIVQQKIRSVAILKCLGATGRQVLATYVLQVLALAAGGSVLGVALGAAAVAAMPASLLTALGVSSIGLTPSAVAQGVTVGLLVSLLFALVPLLEVRHVKPLLLLRVDTTGAARRRDWQSVAASVAVGAALALVAVWQADSVRAGLYVSAGLAAAAGVLYLASRWLVSAATGLGRSRGFVVKHAVVGLSRPGNQTRVILMAVGLGCFFVLGVRAVQTNLLGDLAREVGSNSPDLVLLDVQPDQVARLPSVITPYLRADARIAPLLRGRITAIAGHRVHYDTPDDLRRARQLTREFGLTYRTELEPNERLTAGTFWRTAIEPGAGPAGADTEVSIEQEVHDRSQVDLGDIIQFDIAGQPLRARVTSIRSVEWGESQNGGFVFVLRPGPAVAQVPHTFIGFLQVRDTAEARGAIQRDLVRALPNISVIDVRDVLSSVREVVGNVSLGITAVGAVTLFGGILILVGAVAMTRFQRLYETAIYRTLGASARLVAALIAAEYGVLGALAGLLGAAGALGLSWVLARYLFEIQWQPPTLLLLAGIGITTLGVAAVGLAASADVLVTKPLDRLK